MQVMHHGAEFSILVSSLLYSVSPRIPLEVCRFSPSFRSILADGGGVHSGPVVYMKITRTIQKTQTDNNKTGLL